MSHTETSGLEFLLLSSCLMPGAKTFHENKTSVSVQPNPDESILFFCIDDQTKNPHCKGCGLRQFLWENREGDHICDLILFYGRGADERILCFVELKDNIKDLDKATKQVIETFNGFKQRLRLNNQYKAKGFICSYSGSLPQEHQKYQKKLNDTFGQGNYEFNGEGDKLTEFLRGERKIGKGKRKKSKK